MNKNSFSKQGYALIYAVFYVMLIFITLASISVLALAEIREIKHSSVSVSAYQMAQSGIEEGISYVNKDPNPATCNRTGTRFYVAGGSNESQGYYEYIVKNGSVSAIGYFPEGLNNYSMVYLRADRTGNGYAIRQIGKKEYLTP